jgi:hypothetical protein
MARTGPPVSLSITRTFNARAFSSSRSTETGSSPGVSATVWCARMKGTTPALTAYDFALGTPRRVKRPSLSVVA